MSIPEFDHGAGIYYLRWPEENIAIKVDRMVERRDELTAELLIQTASPGVKNHLHQARHNLLSTAARKTLARHLSTRLNGLDWDGIIEQACVKVVRQYREGEPPVALGSVTIRESLAWRVSPLLLEGQSNAFYGAGQSGKSLLAALISVLVDNGISHLNLEAEPGKVLYIDYETDEQTQARRVRAIHRGLGLEHESSIWYRYGRSPLADDIEAIQKIVFEYGIDLVIIDSLGMGAGGDQDKSMDIIRYFHALRSLKCTTLTIDHVNKEGKQYGNIYKYNETRNLHEVKAEQTPGMDYLNLGLYHRKMNDGKRQHPLGLKIAFRGDAITFEGQDVRDVAELDQARSLKDRLQDEVRRGAASVVDLAERLDTTESSVRGTLNRNKHLFQAIQKEGQREQLWGLLASAD